MATITSSSFGLFSHGAVGQRDLPRLAFESTVPRRWVHRRAVAEVFLTDCVADHSVDRFLVGAQWPRLHGFYRTQSGRYDTMLLAETLRQVAIYLAHTQYRVPLDNRFIMQSMSIEADLPQLLIGDTAAEVSIEVLVPDVQRRDGRVRGLSVELGFFISGVLVGSGRGSTLVVTDEAYDRIRWGKQGARDLGDVLTCMPVDPACVGMQRAEDVALGISRRPHGWQVRTEPTHPVLFDHPCDHMPGMLMLEAMRQAARAELGLPGVDLRSLDVTFHRFVEIDSLAEVIVTVSPDSDMTVTAEVVQYGEVMGTATIVVEPTARHLVPTTSDAR